MLARPINLLDRVFCGHPRIRSRGGERILRLPDQIVAAWTVAHVESESTNTTYRWASQPARIEAAAKAPLMPGVGEGVGEVWGKESGFEEERVMSLV